MSILLYLPLAHNCVRQVPTHMPYRVSHLRPTRATPYVRTLTRTRNREGRL
jgi:hypothetical protein